MTSNIKIYNEGDLYKQFTDELSYISFNYKINISDFVMSYLVKLVSKATTTSHFVDKLPTDIYISCLENSSHDKSNLYREMSDLSLILLGYFPDAVAKRASINYYIELGKIGYYNLYTSKNNKLYYEMSDLFPDLVMILNYHSDSLRKYSNDELIMMYYNWIETREPFLKRRLDVNGFIINGAFNSSKENRDI